MPSDFFMEPPPIPPAPLQSGDKTLAVLCHVSIFLGVGFILPLIVYLVNRATNPLVAAHAKEVLNFHLSLLLYSIALVPLVFLLFCLVFPLYGALALLGIICAIVGAIQAAEGGFYFYPLTIRLFR